MALHIETVTSIPGTRWRWPDSGPRRSAGSSARTKTATCGWSRHPAPRYGSCRPLLFLGVPESKTVKNRIHLDLRPDDQALEVERLEELGACQISVGQTGLEDWLVMADPRATNSACSATLSRRRPDPPPPRLWPRPPCDRPRAGRGAACAPAPP